MGRFRKSFAGGRSIGRSKVASCFSRPALAATPFAFFLALFLACATPSQPPVLLDVPFISQPPNQCGPVALLMVARYYGLSPDPGAIRDATYVPALSGTLPELLLDAAADIGLAHSRALPATSADPSAILFSLSEGHPVILLLAPPPLAADPDLGHFLVATGYNPANRALRVHSGDTPDRWLPAQSWIPRLSAALLLAP